MLASLSQESGDSKTALWGLVGLIDNVYVYASTLVWLTQFDGGSESFWSTVSGGDCTLWPCREKGKGIQGV